MRVIDADALKYELFADNYNAKMTSQEVADCIDNSPTIDAVPVVRGEWMDDMYFDEPVTRCTACKRGFAKGHKAERFPYCPNCGTKMESEVHNG